jgi:hypothetical protein
MILKLYPAYKVQTDRIIPYHYVYCLCHSADNFCVISVCKFFCRPKKKEFNMSFIFSRLSADAWCWNFALITIYIKSPNLFNTNEKKKKRSNNKECWHQKDSFTTQNILTEINCLLSTFIWEDSGGNKHHLIPHYCKLNFENVVISHCLICNIDDRKNNNPTNDQSQARDIFLISVPEAINKTSFWEV